MIQDLKEKNIGINMKRKNYSKLKREQKKGKVII